MYCHRCPPEGISGDPISANNQGKNQLSEHALNTTRYISTPHGYIALIFHPFVQHAEIHGIRLAKCNIRRFSRHGD